MSAPFQKTGDARILNAMTVDVEDYFQVSAFSGSVTAANWDSYESRVVANTERLLELFAASDVVATFFVLGWVAERLPDLIRKVEAQGHEIGVHGYNHLLLTEITPQEFEEDLAKALEATGDGQGGLADRWRSGAQALVERRRRILAEHLARVGKI